jgi:hypothetical protein
MVLVKIFGGSNWDLAEMLFKERGNWLKDHLVVGSAPSSDRKQSLKKCCNAIEYSPHRILSLADLEALEYDCNLFKENVLTVVHSEPFQCYIDHTAELGKLGSTLLSVLCTSQTAMVKKRFLDKTQEILSGKKGDKPVKLFPL